MKGLCWSTAGESHGPALVAILEGMPSGLALDLERVDRELARRQRGYGRSKRQEIERDAAELLAGTKGGVTIGSPIALRIANRDATIESLPAPASPRPGHADLAGCQKHGHRDARAVLERASARETAARVAIGAVARQAIEALGVEVFAHVVELGGVPVEPGAFERAGARREALREASAFRCLDPGAEERFRAAVDEAREAGDTLGGVIEVRALGLPPGLGGYDRGEARLTSRLGAALLSIPAMKGVAFGDGFEAARRRGSEVHDEIVPAGEGSPARLGRFRRATNRAGGLEGGMTTGEELVVRVAMKPIPTLRRGLASVSFETGEPLRATYQRSDVTAVPAASVVGEALVALELASAVLEAFPGASMDALRAGWEAHLSRIRDV